MLVGMGFSLPTAFTWDIELASGRRTGMSEALAMLSPELTDPYDCEDLTSVAHP